MQHLEFSLIDLFATVSSLGSLLKQKHLSMEGEGLLAPLCGVVGRLICRGGRLGVLETEGVVQVVARVVGHPIVRVGIRVEGLLLLDGSRRRNRLLHYLFLFLLLHILHGGPGWQRHNLALDGPRRVVNQAVGVPVGVAVVLHALEGAHRAWGGFLHQDQRRRWGRGRFLGRRRERLRHGHRLRGGLLRGAVGVVAGVTEHRHGPRGHVDDVGLAQRVLLVAQVQDIGLRDGRGGRQRGRGGGRGRCGLRDPLHGGRRRQSHNFALLVGGGVAHDGGHAQFALEVGGVRAVDVLQVPHLLVEHPQLVDLIELRDRGGHQLFVSHITSTGS